MWLRLHLTADIHLTVLVELRQNNNKERAFIEI